MARCLVTGAAGGIGSHLCERLIADGHDVLGLDNYATGQFRAPYIQEWDIAKERPNLRGKFDWIFHLAALADIVPSIENPIQYHTANVTGTIRMLEFARWSRSTKFIYAASSSCYGANPPLPTNEHAPIDCRYPYALTKHLGEQYVLHYARTFGLQACSLRLFNVYGPRFRTRGAYGAVFGVFLGQLAQKHKLTIIGDGMQSRDFTHVSDVVDAFVRAAGRAQRGDVFNIGTGRPFPIVELAHEMLKASGCPAPWMETVNVPDRPGEPRTTQANWYRAGKLLGWTPRINIETGVRDMLTHLDEYKTAPLWTPMNIEHATRNWNKYLGDSK